MAIEWLFEEDAALSPSTIPLGTRLRYGVGAGYLGGLALGSAWGFAYGMADPRGITPKLRLNCLANACANRGPAVANAFGILTLTYVLGHGALRWLRGGHEDSIGVVGCSLASGLASAFATIPLASSKNRSLVGFGMGIGLAGCILGYSRLHHHHHQVESKEGAL